MLRSRTRRGQIEMIDEIALLTRHAEVLASQERALSGPGEVGQLAAVLRRSQSLLAALRNDLASGDQTVDTRQDIAALHSFAVKQVAKAERDDPSASRAKSPEHR